MNQPKQYRKKPVVISAMQWTGVNYFDLSTFCGDDVTDMDDEGYLVIKTLEGDMRAEVGDFVIRGVKGEFYPIKRDIFEATYDEVNEGDDTLDPIESLLHGNPRA